MNFGCVVVTYNRLEKLRKTLKYYDEQLSNGDVLIVVDNGSKEDTHSYLEEWAKENGDAYKRIYMRMEDNNGGAFGFKQGLIKATELGVDWCMISDDDAYLTNEYIKNCKKYITEATEGIGAICSKVTYSDGRIQYLHRRYLRKRFFFLEETNSSDSDYLQAEFKINLFSFVGVCLRMSAIKKIGYPDDTYFIWHDDADLSTRMDLNYEILCYPDMVMIHDCDNNGANREVTFKEYYGLRNRLITLKKYYPRRYYQVYLLKLKLRCISNSYKCPRRVDIIKDSIKDFENGVVGKNHKYLPGTFNEQ